VCVSAQRCASVCKDVNTTLLLACKVDEPRHCNFHCARLLLEVRQVQTQAHAHKYTTHTHIDTHTDVIAYLRVCVGLAIAMRTNSVSGRGIFASLWSCVGLTRTYLRELACINTPHIRHCICILFSTVSVHV